MKSHLFFPKVVLIGVFLLSLLAPPERVMSAPATTVPPLGNVTAIAASENHTCALISSGGVKCWGDNQYGQLGDGTITDRNTPWWVSGLNGIIAITAGRFHTCALTSGGGVKCWGANNYGQLGDGTNNARHTPVNVSNLTNVTAISAGSYHTCALTNAGAMKCWGYNFDGQLGDNTTTSRNEPVAVSGMANGVSAISAGWAHTCAVTSTGRAKCWGNNVRGQVGDNSTTERHTPVTVSGLANGVSGITTGGYHSCALMAAGGAKCWGWNRYGQLGNNSNVQSLIPVDVIWLASGVGPLYANGHHTCALTTDNGVRCWGWNLYGQLGDGSNTDRDTPANVSGLASGVTAVSSGWMNACVLMSGGGVKCWGDNGYGQLGDGTTTDSNVPVDVVMPQLVYRSAATLDGWVVEFGENSNTGGSLNTNASLVVGDNAANKQYRSILYFNTATLPDNAVILRVTLNIKKSSVIGTDPFTTHGNLLADIKTGLFGVAALETSDFEAAASKNNVGSFTDGASGWYKLILAAADHTYVNLTGITQFRLRFATDDNDDRGADYTAFYAGDAASNANRPLLIVEYYIP